MFSDAVSRKVDCVGDGVSGASPRQLERRSLRREDQPQRATWLFTLSAIAALIRIPSSISQESLGIGKDWAGGGVSVTNSAAPSRLDQGFRITRVAAVP